MITKEQVPSILGHRAYDSSHKEIGEVGEVFLDNETGQPEWLTVRTGSDSEEIFVPMRPAEMRGDEVVVPFQKEQINGAPRLNPRIGRLSPEEEAQLYTYYGMQYQPMGPESANEPVTVSEERLHVGKETREVGRARLRKYVVTENKQQTIPVRRETARLEREPITDQNREQARAAGISEADREVVLEEERPMVAKETVPTERLRLTKETETQDETVGGQIRKERVNVEGVPKDQQR